MQIGVLAAGTQEREMTPTQIVHAAMPGADQSLVEHVLWGMTPFPMGEVTARTIYKAASRCRRAAENDRILCDCCPNIVDPSYRFYCKPCGDVLRGSR